jgi:hypothetical protein
MDPIAFLQKKWQGLVANATPLFWTAVSIVLVAAFLFFFYTPPQSMIGPEQPIPFSHRLHAGHKAIQCQYCHPYVGHSNHPGLPPVEKCLHCHNYIIANHWWIQEEHRYFNTQTPTPWVKVIFCPSMCCSTTSGTSASASNARPVMVLWRPRTASKESTSKWGSASTAMKRKRSTWAAGWRAIADGARPRTL